MLSKEFARLLSTRPELAGSYAGWLAAVRSSLKSADFEERLVSRTLDGLRIDPLYPAAEGQSSVGRRSFGPWRVSQRVDQPDADDAQAQALDDLENGADALTIVINGSLAARGFGVSPNRSELERTLSSVHLDLIALRLDAGGHGLAVAEALRTIAECRGHRPHELEIDLGLDPIGTMAASGRCCTDFSLLSRQIAAPFATWKAHGLRGSVLMADGRCYHEAGATEALELAAVLATGVAYLRALAEQGIPLAEARDAVAFLLSVDADQFLSIAKLRALRRLWRFIEEECGLKPHPIRLHAETAWRMYTRRDPWVNILRTTVAAFSAGVGGADAVTVLPFTSALGLPDRFGRRLARNQQLILLEEAHLWRVADPASGAGGFEALTDKLTHDAWRQFQRIEHAGGILNTLKSGSFQSLIAQSDAIHAMAVATRRQPITGTSEFPDINELSVPVLVSAQVHSGHARTPWPIEADAIEALPSRRSSEPFERLRDNSDVLIANTGKRRKIFVATLGPVTAYSERAIFAKNAFEAVGVESIRLADEEVQFDFAAAFRASGADMACLCSSDAIYATEEASSAAQALKLAGAAPLFLCGPTELSVPLREAGITHVFGRYSNLLALVPAAPFSSTS